MQTTPFTVKHVDTYGPISYRQTDYVEFRPETDVTPDQVLIGLPGCTGNLQEPMRTYAIASGSVYIMNSQGKTVDAYHFGSRDANLGQAAD